MTSPHILDGRFFKHLAGALTLATLSIASTHALADHSDMNPNVSEVNARHSPSPRNHVVNP